MQVRRIEWEKLSGAERQWTPETNVHCISSGGVRLKTPAALTNLSIEINKHIGSLENFHINTFA